MPPRPNGSECFATVRGADQVCASFVEVKAESRFQSHDYSPVRRHQWLPATAGGSVCSAVAAPQVYPAVLEVLSDLISLAVLSLSPLAFHRTDWWVCADEPVLVGLETFWSNVTGLSQCSRVAGAAHPLGSGSWKYSRIGSDADHPHPCLAS